MNKSEVFNEELQYIKNKDIKDATIFMINLLPDYFFEIPASSTGKYHPSFAASNNGLVKHTKVAVRIAIELLSNPALHRFDDRTKDLIIMSLILHDGIKSGISKEQYTRFDHPLLIANLIKENKTNLNLNDIEIDKISKMISSHMGPWNTDYNGNEILPVPVSAEERFVHMCDYLSSKKFLDVEFDGINIKYKK